MGFRLVVSDVIEFPIKVSVNDGPKAVPFSFTLVGRRMGVDEYRTAVGDGATATVREFLVANVTGWKGQRLVIDDDTSQPADFSPEAFSALLGVVGLEGACFGAYLKALAASDTTEGRQKN
jgi:hypothetical protein